MNYPRKGKRSRVRDETDMVCVVQENESDKFLLLQRPSTGLLANLFEFPSFSSNVFGGESVSAKDMKAKLLRELGKSLGEEWILSASCEGEVVHQFSHIRQKYVVWKVKVENPIKTEMVGAKKWHQKEEWMSEEEVNTAAISTAMKKVFRLIREELTKKGSKRKLEHAIGDSGNGKKKQKSIKSFFSPK